MLHLHYRKKNPKTNSIGSELYQQDSTAIATPTWLSAGAPAAAAQKPEQQQSSRVCPCMPATTAFTHFSQCVQKKYINTVTNGFLEKWERYAAMFPKC